MLTGSIAIELMSADSGEGGQWIKLLPNGTFSGRDGRGPYIVEDQEAVIAASRMQAGRAQIPIDYDHQIDLHRQNGKPALAAGWCKGLQARADGIWGLIEWTARALKYFEDREYRYLSPAFNHTAKGVVTCIVRGALTNNPNLDQLPALASMESAMDDQLTELRELLSLADDADMPAIKGAVSELLTARHVANPDPAKYVPIGDFERVVKEVNKLSRGVTLAEAADHVARQIREGNMVPALRDWAISLCEVNKPAFDTFIHNTKGAINKLLAPSGARASPPNAEGASQLDDNELAMCQRLGVSEAQFIKSKTSLQTARG